MTHSGAIAATMTAVASAPIRGRPTLSSCGATSIVAVGNFRQEAWLAATAAAIAVAIGRRSSSIQSFLGGGIGLLLALVVVVWLASGFYIVDASQRGLVLQFGRYKESTDPVCAGDCRIRSSRMNWSTFPACARSRSAIAAAKEQGSQGSADAHR
jgi:hypothetical protein